MDDRKAASYIGWYDVACDEERHGDGGGIGVVTHPLKRR